MNVRSPTPGREAGQRVALEEVRNADRVEPEVEPGDVAASERRERRAGCALVIAAELVRRRALAGTS